MTTHALVVAIAACLVGFAGIVKLRSPTSTAGALAAAGVPGRDATVYVLAAVEVVTAVAVLAVGSRLAVVALAVLYTAFALFVAQALVRRLPIQSCGCFAKVDMAPRPIHVVANVTAAGAAFSIGTPGPFLGVTGWTAVATVLVAAGLAQLLVVSASELPLWRAAMRGHR